MKTKRLDMKLGRYNGSLGSEYCYGDKRRDWIWNIDIRGGAGRTCCL